MEHRYKMGNIILIIIDEVYKLLMDKNQSKQSSDESGGLLLGRTTISGITKIFEITEPMENDIRRRCFFKRRDRGHIIKLAEANRRCLYYKGNWHTHPQDFASPSFIDTKAWEKAMIKSKPGDSDYIYFIIVGIKSIRVWCGNMTTHKINEMEYIIEGGGVYEI